MLACHGARESFNLGLALTLNGRAHPMLRRSLSLLAFFLAVLSLAHAQTPLRLVNVTPCRLVDTRQPYGSGPFQGTKVFNLPQSASSGGAYGTCTPFSLSTAQAYSLNVTLVPVNNGPVGYLTIWPTSEPQPYVSLMNSDGRTKANAAIVPAGTSGEVSVYVTNTTNVLIDIDAYFDAASDRSTLAFFSLTPCRLVDTRQQNNGAGFHGTETFNLPQSASSGGAYGTCTPFSLSTAQAYSLNVTALPVNSGPLGYLTLWPAGGSQPVVSTLNDYTGTIVANAAIVPAGSEQQTDVYATNQTNLLIDIDGYFAPASSASNPLSLYPLTPCRVLDTRNGIGLFNGTTPVGIVGSACGVPAASPEAFVLNATVVPYGDLLYLTLWPEGLIQPTVSTLNAEDGAITSNMAIVPAGAGDDSIDAFAPTDSETQLILDISSYFAPIVALNIETSSLPNGTLNDGYSMQLVAVGGVAPYTWTRTEGSLPTGLTLTSGGLIQGTTTATGNFSFTVKATDSNSPAGTVTANLGITVNGTLQTLGVTTTSLAGATVNTAYNALLTANGGVTPYTWSILSGSLPSGLTLNPGTGQISGLPGAAGLSNLTVKVTDAQSHTATQALTVTVNTGDANGTLNGMYAGSFAGYFGSDDNSWFVIAFSFTADGNGNVTGGEYDQNEAGHGVTHGAVTGGSYSIGSNGLGSITLTTSSGGGQLLVSTGAAEEMRIISYNTNGSQGTWGAGVVRQQNPSDFSAAALAGNWALGLQGFDSSGNPLAADGTYQQDSSGNFSGNEDINDNGTDYQVTLTGGHPTSSIDSNGRVTTQVQLSGGLGTVNKAEYVISANELVGIRIDSGESLYVSSALRQSGGPFTDASLHGNAVARESKHATANNGSPVSEVVVGLVTADGQGNLTITTDENKGGVIAYQQTQRGTYSVASNGRMTSLDEVCYIVQQNEGFCIETTSGNGDPDVFFFEPQAAGPFSNASLSGEFLGGSLPQYVSSTASSILSIFPDGIGDWSAVYSQSGPSGTIQNEPGTGTYMVDSTGAITLSQSGSPIAYGYVVGPGQFFVISTNDDPRTFVQVKSSAP